MLVALAAAVVVAPPAQAGVGGDAATARAGLERAVREGRIAPMEADRYREALRRATAAAWTLPEPRRSAVASVIRMTAEQAGRYEWARALSLFFTLDFNARYLRAHALPAFGTDVVDADGVVYRSYGSGGLRFHPLGSFGRLNALAQKRDRRATILAFALLARAEERYGGLVWESFVRTSGGSPPWTSGMTQAVAAQALSRVGMPKEARQAYVPVVRAHLQSTGFGPWIRLYHFNSDLVLNAQLQAALSLAEYGRRTNDAGARELAARFRDAAAEALHRFDTGTWSRYSLGGPEASLTYHTYVASLLWKLSHATGSPLWGRYAARFRRDWREPPRVTAPEPAPPIYPVPADGFRDAAPVRFLLSKPALVTVGIADSTQTLRLNPGAHAFTWEPGPRRPGSYNVVVTARDRVGNVSRTRLPPIRIARDTTPPRVAAAVAGRRLHWRAVDRETPWLDVRVVVRRGGGTSVRKLSSRTLRGSAELGLDLGRTWHVTLVARDSTGNRTTLVVGRVGGLGRYPAGTTIE